MSPAKKKTATAASPKFPRLASLIAGWGKFLLLAILLAGVLGAAGYEIRQLVRDKMLGSEEYQLTAEKIQLQPWPMPVWVQPDPRLEVFKQLSRGGAVSIMDKDLAERVTAAFEQNPWVAKVHRVVKMYPATVEVELDYRRPVLMVHVDRMAYAVDADGISLPTEGCFSAVECAKYPQLIDVDKPPSVGEGKRWGDSRVIGGAEIAAALLPVWEKLHLKWIIPRAISLKAAGNAAEATQSSQFGDYRFEIVAPGPPDENGVPGEKRIYWGKAPVDENSPELSPAQKAKKLEDLAAEYGSLEKCPREIDLNQP